MALGTENRFQESNKKHFIYQKQRPLAPAPISGNNATAPYKKPTNAYFLGTTLDSNNPAVVRRNARERNRVKQVNNGFTNLRQHIPTAIIADLSNGRRGIGPGASKKLSKVDTLKMAVEYIRRLKRVIEDVDGSDTSSVSSFNSIESASSISSSPPPMTGTIGEAQGMGFNCFEAQPSFYGLSYTGLFQQQPTNEHMISPVDSCNSSYTSTSGEPQVNSSLQMKFQQPMVDFKNTSTEDEELLDYISLWQDEL